ncbi:MAG: DUF1350 family protein [Cyanobacteria bacterium P01_A01_bin.123]
MDWREVSGNWILVPDDPIAMVHFLGGAFVGAAPHVAYRLLLEALADQGYAIVATPFINTFDHRAIAQEVLISFEQGLTYLRKRGLMQGYFPIYGLGHSMGCKLHLLINSLYSVERAGNVLMAFNNYSARRSIPLLEQVSQVMDFTPPLFANTMKMEFTPSPEETLAIVRDRYDVRRNLLIKFRKDDIDQTRPLSEVLVPLFPELTTVKILQGTHTTPLAQEIPWQAGESFSPLDAVGQFVKQTVNRDLNPLRDAILRWLDPLGAF